MAKIVIVYHSGFGHTKVLAEAVSRGVDRVSGVEVELLTAKEAKDDLDRLDDADGIVFGAPTYMAGPSAEFKAFADATAKKWFAQAWKDKIAAGFSNSGSLHGDKQNTLQYFCGLAMQHGMVWVGLGTPGPNTESGHGGKPDDVNRVGAYLGAMAQSDNAPPEEAPSSGDRETGEIFGERIARTTLRWVRGAD